MAHDPWLDAQCKSCTVDTQGGSCKVDIQCGSCTVDIQYIYIALSPCYILMYMF